MSVFLAGADELGRTAEENPMIEGGDTSDDETSGITSFDALREAAPASMTDPPASFSRAADDQVQLALAETSHAELNLGHLVRGLQHLVAGASAARDAHATLTRELSTLRELLALGGAAEQAAVERVRAAESALDSLRERSERERRRFIEEEDRFLAELIGDHEREVTGLKKRLADALAAAELGLLLTGRGEEGAEARLGSAVTQPSFPAANWQGPPIGGLEFPVAEWTTPDPAFPINDWAPQPPFSLREFSDERESSEFEKRTRTPWSTSVAESATVESPVAGAPSGMSGMSVVNDVASSGGSAEASTAVDGSGTEVTTDVVVATVTGPADVAASTDVAAALADSDAVVEASAIRERLDGEAPLAAAVASSAAGLADIDPEETPLPSWQAISQLELIRQLPEDERVAAIEASYAREAVVDAPVAPPPSSSETGAVLGVIKTKSVRLPRETPQMAPAPTEEEDVEPLTVRHLTPSPGPIEATEDQAPHLIDTVRPPPLIKPKPDFSRRPLREYSLGSNDVAEEHVDGARHSLSDPPKSR
jgi:hypothetical protein